MPKTVVIIGGGMSGTLVAAGLLGSTHPLQITVVEPRPILGRGLAFSTRCPRHFLNVPAHKLSLVEGQPDDFVRWLQANFDPRAHAFTFAPRPLLARYASEQLGVGLVRSEHGVSLKHLRIEVNALFKKTRGWIARLADGCLIDADAVVIATGNPPACETAMADCNLGSLYFPDPWHPGATQNLDPAAPVLLIGSGLTAIDVMANLDESGHYGAIAMVSRHGLLPRSHALQPGPSISKWRSGPPLSLRHIFSLVRQKVSNAEARGKDWQDAVDSLRLDTSWLWQNLSLLDRQRFLRHVRPYWNVHRHRMPPQAEPFVRRSLSEGRLEIHAGRIVTMDSNQQSAMVQIRLRRRGETASLRVARVINCTGPQYDYRKLKHPLWLDLFKKGITDAGPLGLGLRTTDSGELISHDGHVWPDLITLGPPRIGSLWETTAVPEIRLQAQSIVDILLEMTCPTPDHQIHAIHPESSLWPD